MNPSEALSTLGLAPPATAGEVKRAYRRKIARFHPDRAASKDVAVYTARTKRIVAAFKVLEGHDWVVRKPQRQAPPTMSPEEMTDILRDATTRLRQAQARADAQMRAAQRYTTVNIRFGNVGSTSSGGGSDSFWTKIFGF